MSQTLSSKEYVVSLKSRFALEYTSLRHNGLFLKSYGLPLLIIATGIIMAISTGNHMTADWSIFLGGAFISLRLFRAIVLPSIRYFNNRNKMDKYRCAATITDSGFCLSGTDCELKINWSSISGILYSKNFCFIYFNKMNSAFIIPRNAFNSEGEATAFFDAAENALLAARTVKPAVAA